MMEAEVNVAPVGHLEPLVRATKDLVSGSVGGAGCVLAGQPFDTVKVKFQTFPSLYNSVFSCLKTVVRKEGVRGLYAGSAPAFAVNMGENAVLFMCYGQCQSLVRQVYGVGESTQLSVLHRAQAGSLAAVASSMVVGPLELIKCRRQAQEELVASRGYGRSRTPMQITFDILRGEGIRGLFRGQTSTLAREIPGNFFFFGGYAMAKNLLTPAGKAEADLPGWALVVAGGCGGVAFWLSSYPADVVKSRHQVNASSGKPTSFLFGFAEILRTEGVRGLYRGVTPALLRAFPANGALFYSVELTQRLFDSALTI